MAARAALSDTAYVDAYVAEVRGAAEWTAAELKRMNIRFHMGGGNYMLVWPPKDVSEVVDALDQGGVLVRNMQGKPLLDGCFRLTIGTREQMGRFTRLLASILS